MEHIWVLVLRVELWGRVGLRMLGCINCIWERQRWLWKLRVQLSEVNEILALYQGVRDRDILRITSKVQASVIGCWLIADSTKGTQCLKSVSMCKEDINQEASREEEILQEEIWSSKVDRITCTSGIHHYPHYDHHRHSRNASLGSGSEIPSTSTCNWDKKLRCIMFWVT